jgi:hypothetical protein
MRKLLSSPVNMPLSDAENQVYQNALKYVTPLSLNLMAVKVTHRPDDFLGWCGELARLCREELNKDLLEDEQLLPLKKLQDILEAGFTLSQFKMARIAPWPIFASFIEQQSTIHALDERLRLLNYLDEIRQQPLADLIIEDRLAFSGKHTTQHDYSIYNFDVEWFAGTKGAKVFHTLLEQSPEKFDAALAHIPLTGEVSHANYQSFVNDFQQIFKEYTQTKAQGEKAPLAVATRLLAMRRPDQFIALNNNKIDILCQGLSIAKLKNTDFSSYWHDMIGTMRTFAWWHQAQPEIVEVNSVANEGEESSQDEATGNKENRELILWKNRAVLIDLFLFADADLAPNSNYIKLREKMLNKAKSKSKATPKKRSKESAEILVDKALTSEDLPAYLQGKRDSIIIQVKNGKSVEQAIGLMRAIFG